MARNVWRSVIGRGCAVLLLALGGVADAPSASAQNEPPSAPPLRFEPADRAPELQWKEDWDKTYRENRSAIDAAAKERTSNRSERDRLVNQWMAQLLQAMTDRFSGDPKAQQGRFELADRLANLDRLEQSSEVARGLVKSNPGQLDLAVRAMRRIIENVRRSDGSMTNADAWLDYATSRLATLAASDDVVVAPQWLAEAYQTVVRQRRAEGRYAEAAEALMTLEKARGEDLWTRSERIRLLLELGHAVLARQALESVPRQLVRDESDERSLSSVSEEVERQKPAAEVTVLEDFALAGRWRDARETPTAEGLDALQRADVAGRGIVPLTGQLYASAWSAVDVYVRGRPALREAMGALQEPAAARALAQAESSGRADDLLSAFRSYPWAPSGHGALVRFGEQALWTGRQGVAVWAFSTAVERAWGDLQKQAMTGLIAAGGDAAEEAARTAVHEMGPDATLPWPTGEASVQAVLRRSGSGGTAAARPANAQNLQVLSLPPVATMPMAHLGVGDDRVRDFASRSPALTVTGRHAVTAAPQYLAVWDVGRSEPIWWRHVGGRVTRSGRQDDGEYVVPGPVEPAVGEGTVYVRWGLDPTRRHFQSIAAFDLATGAARWITGGEAWENLRPVSDPVLSDGRLYLVGLVPGMLASSQVVSMDAATGEVLWIRSLATQPPFVTRNNERADVTSYGNRVAVADGAVYVSTSLGVVAKLAAEDGVIQWLRTYPQASFERSMAPIRQRRGGRPVIVENAVIFAPRDYLGLFALDRRSGEMLWQNPMAASVGVIGGHDRGVIGFDDHSLALISAQSGQSIWRQSFPAGLTAAPVIADGGVYLLSGGDVVALDAGSGVIRERADASRAEVMAVAPAGNRLLALSPGQSLMPTAGGSGEDAATIDRPWATLVEVVGDALPPNALLTSSDAVLERWQVDDGAKLVWRRLLERDVQRVALMGDALVVVEPHRLMGLDAATGRPRWRTAPEHPVDAWTTAAGKVIAARTNDRHETWVTAIDPARGSVLWQNKVGQDLRDFRIRHVSGDEARVYVAGDDDRRDDRQFYVIALDPTTGEAAEPVQVAKQAEGRVGAVKYADGRLMVLSEKGQLVTIDLRSGEPLVPVVTLQEFNRSRRTSLAAEGPWITVDQASGRRNSRFYRLHAEHFDGKGQPFRISGKSVSNSEHVPQPIGDELVLTQGRTVQVFAANSDEPRLNIEVEGMQRSDLKVVDVKLEGRELIVLSTEDPRQPQRLYIDRYSLQSGERLSRLTRMFPDAEGVHLSLLEAADRWWLRSPGMLAEVSPGEEQRPVHVIGQQSAVTLDGDLSDWPADAATFTLQSAGGETATLRMMHDGQSLVLAVEHAQPVAAPLVHGDASTAGNRLELAVIGSRSARRFSVGLDDRGQVRWAGTADTSDEPGGAEAAVAHDLLGRRLVYEVALPIDRLSREPLGKSPELSMTVFAWAHSPQSPAPVRFRWGSGLTDSGRFTVGHERVRLTPSAD